MMLPRLNEITTPWICFHGEGVDSAPHLSLQGACLHHLVTPPSEVPVFTHSRGSKGGKVQFGSQVARFSKCLCPADDTLCDSDGSKQLLEVSKVCCQAVCASPAMLTFLSIQNARLTLAPDSVYFQLLSGCAGD
jgi:hypothetical protein